MGLRRVELALGSSVRRTLFSPMGQGGSVSVGGLAVPSAPTNLAATGGTQQIVLTWDAQGGVTFNLYRGTSSGGESATPIATGLTGTTTTDTGLSDGTAYFYKLKAVNAAGPSLSYSNEATATTISAAPTWVSATGGTTQIALVWTAPTGAVTYKLFRGTTPGGESGTPIQTGLVGTSYTDTGLSNGTTYYYKIEATNGSGDSALSTETSATTIPAAPTWVSAVGGTTQIALTWTAPTGALTYKLYRGTTPGGESGTPVQTGLVGTTFTDTGLTAGTTYYYEIKATGAAGDSALSSETSAITAPATPTNVVATGGTGSIVLTYSAPGATSCNILISSDGGSTYTQTITGQSTTTYTDSSAQANAQASTGLVFYKVQAVNSAGTSASSSAASATEYITAWGIKDWYNLGDTSAAIGSDTLTNNNSVTFVAGKIGNAANLVAASSQYLSHASNAGLQVGVADAWWAGWINLTTKPAVGVNMFGKRQLTTNYEYEFGYTTPSDRFFFAVSSDGTTGANLKSAIANTFGAPSTGTWYFLFAYSDTVNNLIGVSVNGGAFNTAANSGGIFAGTRPMEMGGDASNSRYLNGLLDSTVFGKSPPGGIAAIATQIRDVLYNSGNGRSAPFNG